MSAYQTLDDLGDITGQRVLVRVDFNVPLQDGIVSDSTRIIRALPTINELRAKGAKVILLSHMGRPKGEAKPEYSMEQVKSALLEHVDAVSFVNDCIGENAKAAINAMADGHVLLLENVRFYKGEEANDLGFAKELATNGDIYVNDAFSTAHRAHASTEALAHLLPCYAGRSMQAELEALSSALESPERPVIAFVGGAKVSTKLDLLGNLVSKVDQLVIGGGMANTFLAAQGVDVGKSLCEHDLADTARDILSKAADADCEIVLPSDVVVASELKAGAANRTVRTSDVNADDMILDVGTKSIADIEARLGHAKTVVWNGPLGAFEIAPFDHGTNAAARAVAKRTQAGAIVSVAGGGDTVAALNHAGVGDQFTYVSTAGGAFLEWLEGKDLPGVKALSKTVH